MAVDLERPNAVRITCGREIAPWLAREVEHLGHAVNDLQSTFIEIETTWLQCMRLVLELRTALHVLYELERFPCSTPEDLYRHVSFVPWEELIDPEGYLSIVSRVATPAITNTNFVNQRIKDAVVDRLIDKTGRRPDAGPRRDHAVLNLYWMGGEARLFLNMSGRKLSDRGYRKIPAKAPMQETLAAAVLLAAGYDGTIPMVNPMCGSGTLAIEAGLIAARRPPGLLRSNFGLMHVKNFGHEAWENQRKESRGRRPDATPAPIVAGDIDPQAVEAARRNATTAGVDHLIRFEVGDFAETTVPPGEGVVILNPEYGERLGHSRELEDTYKRIGDFFKQHCPGYRGYVFTGNPKLAKCVGLRTSRRLQFFNARIECRLLEYQLYKGSRRGPDEPDN